MYTLQKMYKTFKTTHTIKTVPDKCRNDQKLTLVRIIIIKMTQKLK